MAKEHLIQDIEIFESCLGQRADFALAWLTFEGLLPPGVRVRMSLVPLSEADWV
ncbi:MAG: hypothetical protein AAF152_21225 [Cyanobacteria bacterium P01_A01_bin.114]